MTYLLEDGLLYFSERTRVRADRISLRLPIDGVLLLNGTRYYPKNGVVRLSPHALREGENTLALRAENRTLPAEGLLFDGEFLTPAGLPQEALLLHAMKRISALEERVRFLEERNRLADERLASRRLFA